MNHKPDRSATAIQIWTLVTLGGQHSRAKIAFHPGKVALNSSAWHNHQPLDHSRKKELPVYLCLSAAGYTNCRMSTKEIMDKFEHPAIKVSGGSYHDQGSQSVQERRKQNDQPTDLRVVPMSSHDEHEHGQICPIA